MLTQSESPVQAPATAIGASSKMLQLLRRRLRQLLRITLVLAIGLALIASTLAIWWLTCLNGLPDIGDPFDVDAIHGFTIPDDENALVFLRRAQEKLILLPELPRSVIANASTIAWSRPTRGSARGWRRIARRSNCFNREPIDPTDSGNRPARSTGRTTPC